MRVYSVYGAAHDEEYSMFARLVTGRYSRDFEDEIHIGRTRRTGWLRRIAAALFGLKQRITRSS